MWVIFLILSVHKAVTCPTGSHHLEDNTACYWVTTSPVAGNTTPCSNDGVLAIIPTAEVNEKLKKLNYLTTEQKQLWIGVNDEVDEGTFKNSDGSNVTWTNWFQKDPQQPNDPNITSLASQDCVVIDSSDGKWYDEECIKNFYALCFKQIYTTSTTVSTTATVEDRTSTETTITSTDVVLTTREIKTTGMTTNNAYKIMVPVLIVGIFILGAIIIACIIILKNRRTRHEAKKTSDVNGDVYSVTHNVQYNTIDIEQIPPENAYCEVRDGEYDAGNENRKKVSDDQLKNLYDHTNVQDSAYDVTNHGNHTTNTTNYHNNMKTTETKPPTKEYEEITNDIVNDAIRPNNAKTHTPTMDNTKVYDCPSKDVFGSVENAYGDLAEGEYDILHKKRNKPNSSTDQIYSHTAGDTYDTTNQDRKADYTDDTYDSTMHGHGNVLHDDTYDSTSRK